MYKPKGGGDKRCALFESGVIINKQGVVATGWTGALLLEPRSNALLYYTKQAT